MLYSGDLNTGLAWYSNGWWLSDRQMVNYLNAIWIPNKIYSGIQTIIWIPDIWILDKQKFVIQMFPLFKCLIIQIPTLSN